MMLQLKAAAAKIPSVPTMPYEDLWPILRQPRTVEESLQCTLWEIYSVPRMQATMIELGGKCRRSFDIRHFWDLGSESFQRTLLTDLSTFHPYAVMLSPPCTWVSSLMHSNWQKVQSQKRVWNLVEACKHIDFSMWVAAYQDDCNRFFAFEHPAGSLAWDRASVTRLNKSKPLKPTMQNHRDTYQYINQGTLILDGHHSIKNLRLG